MYRYFLKAVIPSRPIHQKTDTHGGINGKGTALCRDLRSILVPYGLTTICVWRIRKRYRRPEQVWTFVVIQQEQLVELCDPQYLHNGTADIDESQVDELVLANLDNYDEPTEYMGIQAPHVSQIDDQSPA